MAQEYLSIIDYSTAGYEDQPVVADAFAEIQRDWVAQYQGFVSAQFLASTDGRSVRAIVTWSSKEAFDRFERESDSAGRLAALQSAFDKLSTTGQRQTFHALAIVLPRASADSSGQAEAAQ